MSDDTEITEKVKCKICNDYIDKRSIKCGDSKCSVHIHKKCFDLVAKVFVVEPKNWRCRNCVEECKGRKVSRSVSCSESSPDQVAILKKEVDCLVREKELIAQIASEREYLVDVQKKRIVDLESKNVSSCLCNKKGVYTADQNNSRPVSYSHAVKHSNDPYLLIKSADGTTSSKKVEEDFKSKYTPGSLNVEISKARLTKNGFLISCRNSNDLKNLKQTLESDMGSKYSICESTKLHPRLIIYDIPKTCVKDIPNSNKPVVVDHFIESFISDNSLKATVDDLKVVSLLRSKSSRNIVIEVAPFLFESLNNKGYCFISWNRCRLQEHINIVRCFKCSKYGHLKRDCRSSDPVCPHCSEAHDASSCNNQNLCCPNCKNYNSRFKTTWDTDHAATSNLCNFYNMKIQNLRSNIVYA
nr:unnamed protein product [Callosobruchus analis]